MYQALERGFEGLANGYRRALTTVLRQPAIVLGTSGALLGLTVVVASSLKREFIPADDRGVIFTSVLAPEGSTIGYTDRLPATGRGGVSRDAGGGAMSSRSSAGAPRPTAGLRSGLLKPWEDRKRDVQAVLSELRPKLGAISGVMAFAASPTAVGGGGAPVQFIVKNSDYDSLLASNDRLLKAARAIPGLVNVDTDLKVNKPELTVAFDRDRAEDLGVPVADVATTLQTMLGGSRTGTFTRADNLYDVLLQLDRTRRATPEDMSSLFVRGRGNTLVRLDALAHVTETTGPRAIAHFDRVRNFTLTAAIAPGYTLGEAIDTLTGVVKSQLPSGTTIALGGESRELSESGYQLLFAFGLAILVVFMVLASQFESVVHPFTVLMAVPLAVIGAVFTLKLVGATINLYSQIGMILLVGLVTKNSILLVDCANKLKAEGRDLLDAMIEAGRVRLRPILMTSLATIMGALPVALGIGAGSGSRRPLGYAIVGGILFSTVLTLFVVPSVWLLLERLTGRRRAPAPSIAVVEAP